MHHGRRIGDSRRSAGRCHPEERSDEGSRLSPFTPTHLARRSPSPVSTAQLWQCCPTAAALPPPCALDTGPRLPSTSSVPREHRSNALRARVMVGVAHERTRSAGRAAAMVLDSRALYEQLSVRGARGPRCPTASRGNAAAVWQHCHRAGGHRGLERPRTDPYSSDRATISTRFERPRAKARATASPTTQTRRERSRTPTSRCPTRD